MRITNFLPVNIEYHGYWICADLLNGNFYTVQYCGDDVVFNTVDDARAFIDEINSGGEC